MSAHAAVVESPISTNRHPAEASGRQGRRARRRGDLRAELRAELLLAFSHPAARHRSTFIPLTNQPD